jgi:hypothetical protein
MMLGGGCVTTWTQDYPALPGSADAAARYARTIVAEHLPGRADDAEKIVREMLAVGIARSAARSTMNLITVITEVAAASGHVHFELHYANDAAGTADPASAHQVVSALSNAYGEQDTRDGRMLYAVLWGSAA